MNQAPRKPATLDKASESGYDCHVKMPQHLYCRFHVLLLSTAMALATSGCWWLQKQPVEQPTPTPMPTPSPPAHGLVAKGIITVGIVSFGDATNQGVGQRVAGVFRETLSAALGREWVRQHDLSEPPGAPRPIGFIGISQAQQLGRLNQVDGLLSGQVLAYQWQRPQGRVWVSVSLRLLEAARGTIIWSRNAKGTFPARSPAELDHGFNEATHLAAKEFVHELLGSPP